MVALSVSAIILAAVATLVYAAGAANDTNDNTGRMQAKLRYTTLKISELIKESRLICDAGSGHIILWDSDDNMDGLIGIEEVTYIETINYLDGLRLVTFNSASGSADSTTLSISFLKNSWSRNWLESYFAMRQTVLLRPVECRNVQLEVDAWPPLSHLATVSFYLVEDGRKHHYQIKAAVRCWAGELLVDGELSGSTL
jgi:hypothetical protein